jgi:N-acetylglucosaminyl-diphospho-decaprenol L-rhamnosyltransferase
MTTETARFDACVFADPEQIADCVAIVVTYNSAADIGGLLDSMPAAAAGLRLRIVVVDKNSADHVASVVARYPRVRFVPTGGNLGYAGAINVGRRHRRPTRFVLVLNPDLVLAPGSIRALLAGLRGPRTGAAVPRILDEHGRLFPSLRREPSLARALADGLLGRPGRTGRRGFPRW